MRVFAEVWERIRCLLFRAGEEQEMDEELRFHLEMATQKNVEAGMHPREARRQAHLRFGGVERFKEEVREARGIRVLDDLWMDLRYAVRTCLRAPGFTAAAILILALGIGVNSTIFSVVNALLLRPLPVRDAEELVTISKVDDHVEVPHGMSYVDYLDLRKQMGEFSELMAYTFVPASLGTGEGAERTWIGAVSGNYFSGLGVDVAVGRTFVPEEDQPYGDFPVLVLSHGTWQWRFGGDPGVVGRAVQVNGQPYTVIGVTKEGFHGTHSLFGIEAYAPLTSLERLRPDLAGSLTGRGAEGLFVIGRLADGVTVADAQAAMQVQAARLAREYPRTHENAGYLVLLESRSRPEPSMSSLTPLVGTVMMGLAGLVLLIACANVAGLLMARAVTRRREMAVHAALGAGRRRLFAQLLSESLLLSIVGGAAGVAVALGVSSVLGNIRFAPDIPVRLDVGIDWRVLAFTAVVAIVTGVVAGVSPAFRLARADLVARLKEGGRGAADSPRRQRARAVLVVAQVAVSLFLLVCSGLFIQSLRSAQQMDFGFRTDNLLLFSVDHITQGYDEPRGRAVYQEIAAQVARVPGVRSVSWARQVPFSSDGLSMTDVVSEDRMATTMDEPAVMAFNFVGAGYFSTMGTAILGGRSFDEEDREDGRPVAVINRTAAERLWPGVDPIGRQFRAAIGGGYGGAVEVIGVTEDPLYMIPITQPRPYVYFPFEQRYQSTATLHVHTDGDPARVAPAARAAVTQSDPTMAVFNLMTMRDHLNAGNALLIFRMGAVTVGAFGGLGLLLAAVGLFALVSFSVGQRQQEFGIRAALGAQTGDIVILAVRQAVTLTVVGVGLGLLLSLGVTRFMADLLVGVGPSDPAVLVTVVLIFGAVALGASWCRRTVPPPATR